MTERIALAYSGSLASSAAVAWLMERRGADVVTVTVDVGQSADLDEVRSRALACGALRAHVIDVRDSFAREHVIPAMRAADVAVAAPLVRLADPLIARTLVEVARIEGADAVAHAAVNDDIDGFIAALDPSLPIVAPARAWSLDANALVAYARTRTLPGTADRTEQHLLIRRVGDPARAAQDARIDLAFADGVPVSINGVQMTLQELVESLSLIGGQYGLGQGDAPPAPAAHLLRAAYRSLSGTDGVVRVELRRGGYTVTGVPLADAELVHHP